MNEETQGPSGDPKRDEQHGIGSINAERTAPYPDPLVNENERATYGATEQEVTRDGNVIAPTFSDTEPGAGTNYGAAGDPGAPNWGGIEDQTTLGPQQVRPAERRLVQEGEFEAGGGTSGDDTPAYGHSPEH
jgi:hypothetical protein